MRIFWLLQIAVILLAPPALYAWGHRRDRVRALTGAALLLAGMNTLFFGTFAVGEVFTDPGGWVAVAWAAVWLIPLVGLGLLAWRHPDPAAVVLAGLLIGLIAVYVWSVLFPDGWRTFEDARGPVRALLAFVLTVPLAVLGRTRPRRAGLMLIAVPALPLLLVLINSLRGLGAQGWPIVLVTAPAAIIGGLYLAAGSQPRGVSRARGGLTPRAS